jgi:hypothetical protein
MTDRIKIRRLQWNCCSIPPKAAPGQWHVARCIVGIYEIHVFDLPAHGGTAFLSVPNGLRMSEHRSVEAAEEAAQNDFERRIMDVIA